MNGIWDRTTGGSLGWTSSKPKSQSTSNEIEVTIRATNTEQTALEFTRLVKLCIVNSMVGTRRVWLQLNH